MGAKAGDVPPETLGTGGGGCPRLCHHQVVGVPDLLMGACPQDGCLPHLGLTADGKVAKRFVMAKKKVGITDLAQNAYFARKCALATLGFKTYKAYLYSALWRDIRQKVLTTTPRCRGCGGPATQVHHRRYNVEDLDGRCFDHLIPVCGTCHHRSEFTKKGMKVDPKTATSHLDGIRQSHQKVWQAQDRSDCWKHFFAVLTDVRVYLGMDESVEARALVEQLDAAREALPKAPGRHRKKRLSELR